MMFWMRLKGGSKGWFWDGYGVFLCRRLWGIRSSGSLHDTLELLAHRMKSFRLLVT
jgi:hypothetical protein